MSVSLALFAVSLATVLYIYVGYPCLIAVVARLRPRPVRRGAVRPTVTLLIPVHDEEEAIEGKVRNSLALDYPEEALEILVVSDGSTDRTEEVVASFPDARVRLLSLSRRGKAASLNAGVKESTGEILVFTDANSRLEADGLTALVENYADPDVGGVCGNKVVVASGDADSTEMGEGIYWRFDQWQKAQESRAGSVFAADGAFHSVRRHLYVPVADPAQADDIAISARVVLQGHRLVFEPRAVAREPAPTEGREEFVRKVRVTNHSVRAVLGLGSALFTRGLWSLEIVSHKLLRHFSPFFLLPLLVSNAILAGSHLLLTLLLVGQLAVYALAGAGWAFRGTRLGQLRALSIPYYFALVNVAAFAGILSIAAGVRSARWDPRGGLGGAGDTP